MKSKKPKYPPVCAVWWRDAAYSYERELPREFPHTQLTTGFVMVATDDYLNIATNVSYDEKNGTIWPIDGFVIPKKAVVEFMKVGQLRHA